MDSVPPDDPSHAREPLLVAGGKSIELGALIGRLKQTGVRVVPLSSSDEYENARALQPDLVLWDMATPGLLDCLEAMLGATAGNGDGRLPPELIALGTPPSGAPPEAVAYMGRAIRHFRRPIDVQAVADAVRARLFRPKSTAPGSKAPSQHPSGRGGRLSLPALPHDVEVVVSTSPSLPAPEEPAGIPSRQLSTSGSEHSVVSPELASLLAEAESRVEAQMALEAHAGASQPPVPREVEELGEDVWRALNEPLEDDADLQGADALESSRLPSGLGASQPPPPPEVGTLPPEPLEERYPSDDVDEDTGSHSPDPDAETSGSMVPKTATGVAGGVQTTRAAHTRQPLLHADAPTSLPPEGELAHRDDDPEPMGPGLTVAGSSTAGPPSSALDAGPPRTVARGGGAAGNRREAHSEPESDDEPAALSDDDERFAASSVPERAARETQPPESLRSELERGPTSAPPRQSTLSNEDSEAPRTLEPRHEPPPSEPLTIALDLPAALVLGASMLALGQAVRRRFSGCLAFEVDLGLRRVVLRDGDVVIAASAVHGESLVSYLAQRGDLTSEAATQIEHRIPNFGRHAGAALIARGLLEQGELWPVLRAHAEWVLGRILRIERGTVREESPVPERLAAEPAVFGGATGAEVLVEAVQRAVKPDQALSQLGGGESVLEPGDAFDLLGECALPQPLNQRLSKREPLQLRALSASLPEEPMLPSIVQALIALEVLRVSRVKAVERASAARTNPRAAPAPRLVDAPDALDDEALRLKVKARRALVDEGDYFALLGVPREATGYDIRRSYTELKRQFDPGRVLRPNTLDLREDVDAIIDLLDEAYEILRDQGRRERYRRAIESMP
jgi:hypothetical protein